MTDLVAHALIELEDGTRIDRGQPVPDDVPGLRELQAAGSVSTEPYDEAADQLPPPEEVEIDGVVYKRSAERPVQVGEERSDA